MNYQSEEWLQKVARYQLSNETRALFQCYWCSHRFEASATKVEQCPKCQSTSYINRKCVVCGHLFREQSHGGGGRPALVCSGRCRVRKHRVTKQGPDLKTAPRLRENPAHSGRE